MPVVREGMGLWASDCPSCAMNAVACTGALAHFSERWICWLLGGYDVVLG